jgi:hypothetical protein
MTISVLNGASEYTTSVEKNETMSERLTLSSGMIEDAAVPYEWVESGIFVIREHRVAGQEFMSIPFL